MTQHKDRISFRLSPELVAKIDELAIRYAAPGKVGDVTRSAVTRAALERGLLDLERELEAEKKQK
jgi:predicted transcriptional regulator